MDEKVSDGSAQRLNETRYIIPDRAVKAMSNSYSIGDIQEKKLSAVKALVQVDTALIQIQSLFNPRLVALETRPGPHCY